LKQHATKELWAQYVFSTLAQDFGKVDAQEMFTWVFLQNTLFCVDTTNLHTNCGNEALHLTSSEEFGGTGVGLLYLVISPPFS